MDHKLIFSAQRLPSVDQSGPSTAPVSCNEGDIALPQDAHPHRNPEPFGFELIYELSRRFLWMWDLLVIGRPPGKRYLLLEEQMKSCYPT